MVLRSLAFLLFIIAASCVKGQQLRLVDHLNATADFFGYSPVYSPAAIPDTVFAFSILDSASAKTTFHRLTKPFGLTYNLLANQVIITAQEKRLITFSGFVEDVNSGERLVGAAVYVQNSTRGTYSNGYGYFSLPKLDPTDTVTIKYIGYPARNVLASEARSGRMTIRLKSNYQLELVEIFPIDEEVSQIPSAGRSIPLGILRSTEYQRGRPDLNAWLNLQPGINAGAMGFRGFSIRGADPDHNLVMLDDATLYLPSHLAGYMSIIPGEAIKSLQLFKNAGKARYGDRVGGVLDIRMRDGSNDKRRTSVNFGITDISLNTEGPIGKGSYFLSGRRGLTDFWVKALTPTIQPQGSNIPNIDFTFYDLAGKVNYPLGVRQRLYASVFVGRDQYQEADRVTFINGQTQLGYEEESLRSWTNLVSSIRYNITIGSRWFANTTLTVSQFNYDASDLTIQSRGLNEEDPSFESEQLFFGTRLRDFGLRQDAEFAWKEGLSLKIGADITQHRFEVGTLGKDTVGVNVPEVTDPSTLPLPVVNTYDVGTYGYVDWQVNSRLDINAGVRISGQLSSDSLSTFFAVLPRVSLAYRLSKKLSLHADAGLSRQYIHQVSTLNPGLPRDLWVPSVNGLTPQENQYVSLGCTFESSKKQSFGLDLFANRLEGLSRFSNDAIGASLEDWGNTIRRGKGYSYGLELKYAGNLSNLQYDLSYTYSIANRQFEDLFGLSQEEERFKFDRRHLSNLNLRYPITEKWGVGTTLVLGSGLPARIPKVANPLTPAPPLISKPLTNRWIYGDDVFELNSFHQLDVGFRYTKRVKTNVYNLSFGVQNVYGRRNSLFANLRGIENPVEGGSLTGRTLVNAPRFLPFIRYGVNF